ncbi:TetR/AcrR family transcriptional regulator [Aeromicrobium sp. Sec7.5]|uniref:TetR/AcrR family transcriptional regulator n=1 Tax=Aeromicrobium sp. Sec7.5 TaxID=3121276 RepID=UPI002FE49C44
MAKSANEVRRQRTLRAISSCARSLADEHGLDGFTMDQLAESVGVSRRTLFNYVPGKVDAVLGISEPPESELVETFMRGGPTGHLLTDVKELIVVLLDDEGPTPAEVAQVRRLIRSDARLHAAVHERFAEVMERFSDGIAQREGEDVEPLTVRLVATLALSLFDIALDQSLADDSISLAQHYARVFEAAMVVTRP